MLERTPCPISDLWQTTDTTPSGVIETKMRGLSTSPPAMPSPPNLPDLNRRAITTPSSDTAIARPDAKAIFNHCRREIDAALLAYWTASFRVALMPYLAALRQPF
ncbi:hypothetical protein Tamer19_52360 [Cupriavidus sp. TA19]|nr:hypothetical protein Tamer19_52360 [Cupriavidus sp. TA19]